jgi:hypothetical protein
VAQERLHHAEVSAIVQEMTGESVAQDVRAELRAAQARCARQGLELAREMLPGEMAGIAERWE